MSVVTIRPFRAGALLVAAALALAACERRGESVSGTVEVDEVHVASRAGGRVEKVFAREGEQLAAGAPIVKLEAAELPAQLDLARAQVEAALREVESQKAQLEFLRGDTRRQQELLRNRTVSPSEAERAASLANAQEKSVEASEMRVAQAKANLAEIETRLREMTVLSPGPAILEVLSVKVGDVLPPNREVATLILPEYLWVRVYVPQPWLGHIRIGDKVRVRVDAFPERDFGGVVEQVSRQAEFTPRNVQTVEDRVRQVFAVKVRLENGEKLRAGMAADVEFPGVPESLR